MLRRVLIRLREGSCGLNAFPFLIFALLVFSTARRQLRGEFANVLEEVQKDEKISSKPRVKEMLPTLRPYSGVGLLR